MVADIVHINLKIFFKWTYIPDYILSQTHELIGSGFLRLKYILFK
jgi:hypothetical protein